ncbi:hypothetical protein [Embleya hyalina]
MWITTIRSRRAKPSEERIAALDALGMGRPWAGAAGPAGVDWGFSG